MSFVSPSVGITKLSEMEVDTDKPWEAFGITNLKELTATMAKGDMLFFDSTRLVKITPSSIGSILTTHDMGNAPTWEYPP
jgi:hypothetical protein